MIRAINGITLEGLGNLDLGSLLATPTKQPSSVCLGFEGTAPVNDVFAKCAECPDVTTSSSPEISICWVVFDVLLRERNLSLTA